MRSQAPALATTGLAALLALASVATEAGAQTLIGQVTVGGHPGLIAFNPITRRAYIGGIPSQPQTSVIDYSNPAAPVLVTTVTGSGVATNPAANRYYTSTGYGSQVLLYDAATNAVLATSGSTGCGHDLDYDPNTNLVYLAAQCAGGNDPLHVYDGTTLAHVAGPLGTGGVSGSIRVNPTTGRAYPTAGNSLRVFGPSPSFASQGILPGIHIRAEPTLNRLYIMNNGNVDVRDGNTHAIITTLAGQSGPPAVSASMNRIYVGIWSTNVIRVFDATTHALITSFPVAGGLTPWGIHVDPTNNFVLVSASSASMATTFQIYQDLTLQGVNGQANSPAATLTVNGAGTGVAGPFTVATPSGGALMLSWAGPPGSAFELYAGAPQVGYWVIPGLGSVDIVPSFPAVFSGLSPALPGPFFVLGASGTATQTFSINLPPNTTLGHVQGLVYQPGGAPVPAVLTAAFTLTVI